jgi:serine/threonine-protein kinase
VVISASDTQTGVVGTPGYMAPEQARSQQPDPRSDIYSFGCMAYEMLTGTQPFRGETPVDVMMRHITEHPTPPRALAPALPPHTEVAILKAMAKDPAERWPRAILFVQALLGQVLPEGVQTVSLHGHPQLPVTPASLLRPLLTPAPTVPSRQGRFARRIVMAGMLLAAVPFAWRWGAPKSAVPPDAALVPSASAALAGARRALDEGAYPEALQLTDLALSLDPGRGETQILRERVRRAWEAERSLGLWRAPDPTPGPPQPTDVAASP